MHNILMADKRENGVLVIGQIMVVQLVMLTFYRSCANERFQMKLCMSVIIFYDLITLKKVRSFYQIHTHKCSKHRSKLTL